MIHRLQHDYKNGKKPLPHTTGLFYFPFSLFSRRHRTNHILRLQWTQQQQSEQPQQQKSLKTMHSFECCLFRCLLVCFIRTDEHGSTCCRSRLWLHTLWSLVAMRPLRHQQQLHILTRIQSRQTCATLDTTRREKCIHRGLQRLVFGVSTCLASGKSHFLCHSMVSTEQRLLHKSQYSRSYNGNLFLHFDCDRWSCIGCVFLNKLLELHPLAHII